MHEDNSWLTMRIYILVLVLYEDCMKDGGKEVENM